jgi:hypothetical protein
VRSGFLIGASAWLLGAVAATTGSMIAVSALAHGLLSPQTELLSGTPSNADIDAGRSVSPTPPTASPSISPSPSALPIQPSSGLGPQAGGAEPPREAPTLLTSTDGSVLASCQPGGAYLVYWSPNQGYTADDVFRGPAQVASVTFRNTAGGVLMRVSCSSGIPVAHVSSISPEPEPSPSLSGV